MKEFAEEHDFDGLETVRDEVNEVACMALISEELPAGSQIKFPSDIIDLFQTIQFNL